MRFPSKEVVERIRSEYPVGTRVELARMVAWDNGCGLSVAFGEDLCRKVETTSDGAKRL